MSIPKTEIEQLKTCVDLLALCGSELTRVANTNGGEYAGPCPFCGGEDRFHIQPYTESGSRWFCRQCTGDPQVGYWRDVFDFVMCRDGIGFVDAYDCWQMVRPAHLQPLCVICPKSAQERQKRAGQPSGKGRHGNKCVKLPLNSSRPTRRRQVTTTYPAAALRPRRSTHGSWVTPWSGTSC